MEQDLETNQNFTLFFFFFFYRKRFRQKKPPVTAVPCISVCVCVCECAEPLEGRALQGGAQQEPGVHTHTPTHTPPTLDAIPI